MDWGDWWATVHGTAESDTTEWLTLSHEYISLYTWVHTILIYVGNIHTYTTYTHIISSVAQSCPSLCNSMDCSTPGFLSFTISQNLLKLMSIELVMPSNHLILCHPLLLLSSIFLSIRVFSNELALGIRWPKYWSFSFSISPSNEYSGLISFRIDWLDLPAVQGTLRVFPSITVQKHQFFSTQHSLWSNSHICTWLLEEPYLWLYGPLSAKWCPCFFSAV